MPGGRFPTEKKRVSECQVDLNEGNTVLCFRHTIHLNKKELYKEAKSKLIYCCIVHCHVDCVHNAVFVFVIVLVFVLIFVLSLKAGIGATK